MPAIPNQQTGLTNLISINGTQITEHNRKTQISTEISGTEKELVNGSSKRYAQTNKNSFAISFSYLPNTSDATVDGRVGRDFLKTISQTRGTVTLSIKLDPNDAIKNYTCFVSSYSETLIRRDIVNARSFYDVSIQLDEQ